ncbi:MAG: aconitase X catalytic domain-containing protein [Synergistales bacterium]|nr:aconitase X catalytic domain-containing protein [Synergistales bacterium]
MYFSEEEQRMLDGKEGLLKRKAMENVVAYGEVVGAERLCRVTKAHLFCGAHHYLEALDTDDIDVVMSQMHFCSDERVVLDRVACYAQSDVGPMCPLGWNGMGVPEAERARNEAYLSRYLDAGVHLVGSCIPYMLGFVPLMGEHYVSSESHAVLMMNALWGACGHADGLEAGFWSAVCGRTPYWGLHDRSNRKGTLLFSVQCATETLLDWDLLGYTIGKRTPPRHIPVLVSGFSRPDITTLKAAFASMATTGGAEMCHIVGVTPEAATLEEATGGRRGLETVAITDGDIEASRADLDDPGRDKVQLVSLGCPHYTLDQLRETAAFLDGKSVAPSVTLQVWTALPIKETADRCGYTGAIERAGGQVLTSSCPLTSECFPREGAALVFDSAKQAHYIRPAVQTSVHYGSMEHCLESALGGYWEGGER